MLSGSWFFFHNQCISLSIHLDFLFMLRVHDISFVLVSLRGICAILVKDIFITFRAEHKKNHKTTVHTITTYVNYYILPRVYTFPYIFHYTNHWEIRFMTTWWYMPRRVTEDSIYIRFRVFDQVHKGILKCLSRICTWLDREVFIPNLSLSLSSDTEAL